MAFRGSLYLMAEACSNVEKLPAALISGGVMQAVLGLALAIFKAPGGIFLHHGKPALRLYYGINIAAVIFGVAEASIGFWVSGDLINRCTRGKITLWISIFPLVGVAALGLGEFGVLKW